MEFHKTFKAYLLMAVVTLATACVPSDRGDPEETDLRIVVYTEEREPCKHYTATRQALFGDLHVHSAYSFDAAANSLETYPDLRLR